MSSVDAGFFGPYTGVPSKGNELVFGVNMTGVADPEVFIRETGDSDFIMGDVSPLDGNYSLASSHVFPRVYEYYYLDGSGSLRFPASGDGLKVSVPGSRGVFFGKAVNVSLADPMTSCAPSGGDLSCDYENEQASMMMGLSEAYHLSGNVSYREVLFGFLSTPVDEMNYPGDGFHHTCDYMRGDFDCDDINLNWDPDMQPSGARRQAHMIYSMWEIYKRTGNASARGFAVDYANGSAEGCDVWGGVFSTEPDYDCGNALDQGLMMLAYFESYEQTGDDTYLEIAYNLSDSGASYGSSGSDMLALGFFKGYELTGNETYLELGLDVAYSRIGACDGQSCSVFNQSMNVISLIRAYEMTGNYSLKVEAYDAVRQDFAGPCNPWNDTYSCATPLEQGALVEALFRAYQVIGDDSGFYASVHGMPVRSSDLTINVSFLGIVREPVIYFRRIGDKWNSGNVSSDGSYAIPGIYLSAVGAYEYYFLDNFSGVRFPRGDGSLKFAVSDRNETFGLIAGNLSATDPSDEVSFVYCGTQSDDFVCSFDNFQGAMIYGFSQAYGCTASTDYLDGAYGFHVGEIDDSDSIWGSDQWATCDYSDDDFDCGTDSVDDSLSVSDFDGALRQAWMGYSLWDVYSVALNSSFKNTALDYSFGSAEGCDVWAETPDHDCGSPENQGMMIMSYALAYRMTGDERLLWVVSNLSSAGYSMGDSDYLALGLLEAYDVLGNSSYLERAIGMVDSRAGVCIDSSCDALDYSFAGLAAWGAYGHTGESYYLNLSVNKTLASPSSGCDPWGGTPDYSCYYPDEQGAMMGLFYEAYSGYVGDLDVYSVGANISGLYAIDVGESINVSCLVENDGDGILYDVNVSLYTDDGLNITGDVSYYFESLNVLDNVSVNWSVEALESGMSQLYCNVSTYEVNGSDSDWISVDTGSSVNLSLDTPDSVVINDNFNVTCIVENNGSIELHDVNVSLSIPDALNTTDTIHYNLENLSIDEMHTLNWTLGALEAGIHPLSCNLTSTEINSSVTEFVDVGAWAGLDVNMSYNESFFDDEYLNVSCMVSNNGTLVLNDVNVSLNFSEGLYTLDDASYYLDNLTVGDDFVVNWTIRSIDAGNKYVGCIVNTYEYNASVLGNVSVIKAYDVAVNVIVPDSVTVGDLFNVSCIVDNNASKTLNELNVSIGFDDGLSVVGNMSYNYSSLGPGQNTTFNWTISASSAGLKQIYCNISTYELNRSVNGSVLVNALPLDEPESPSGGGGSSGHSYVSGPAVTYLYVNETYDYHYGNDSLYVFDVANVSSVFDSFSPLEYALDGGGFLSYDVNDYAGLFPDCYDVSRFYEATANYSRYGLYIRNLCTERLDVLISDVMPSAFVGNSSVIVDSSKKIDIFGSDDDLSYLFHVGRVRAGEILSINYTVGKSVLFDMLDLVDRPAIYAIDYRYDMDAPIFNITYPLDGANLSSGDFELSLEIFDESNASCEYSIDGAGFLIMDVAYPTGFSSLVNVSFGEHCIDVVCGDSYNNSGLSSVCFSVLSVNDSKDDVSDVDDDSGFLDFFDLSKIIGMFNLGDIHIDLEIDYGLLLFLLALFLLAGILGYLLYRLGYLSYFGLDLSLKIMIILDRLGHVRRSFAMYPIVVWLYDQLNMNPGLKESMMLRKDLSRVMGVLELYSITRKVSQAVAVGEDAGMVERSLPAIKTMYAGLSACDDVNPHFLLWVRDKYIESLEYLSLLRGNQVNLNK